MEDTSMKKFYEDVKELIKSIGTSSSINEERDERSVENYVRTGGNTMENTTEPDPQGDIAVTKAYPDASSDSKHVIDQATRPTEDAKVSDAPEGPVPTNETSPSDATSAIAPSKTDEVNTPDDVEIEKAATCKECGQALPIEKAEGCADCGKPMNLCDCMGKSVDEESGEKDPDDEKSEMKKSLWGGAFAPRIK
jgi:hypothetical protein